MKPDRLAMLAVWCFLGTLAWLPTAHGDVRLPHVFGEHLVLQRGKPVRVSGWAAPGERVEVSFADQKESLVADEAGTWLWAKSG